MTKVLARCRGTNVAEPALEKQTELVNIITDIVATIKTKLHSRQDRYGDQIDTSTDLSADSVDRYSTEGYTNYTRSEFY